MPSKLRDFSAVVPHARGLRGRQYVFFCRVPISDSSGVIRDLFVSYVDTLMGIDELEKLHTDQMIDPLQ